MTNHNPHTSWNAQIEELADEMEIPELEWHPLDAASSCLARDDEAGILTK